METNPFQTTCRIIHHTAGILIFAVFLSYCSIFHFFHEKNFPHQYIVHDLEYSSLQMATEITEANDDFLDKEAEKMRIRQLIEYQKSMYLSSSSFSSSTAASTSSFTSSRKSNSLLDLMKGGSTSLRRLFDMEHTSLGNYLMDYSVSTIIKPVPLWGSDTDDDSHDDPWAEMKQMKDAFDSLMSVQMASNIQVFTQRSGKSKRKLYRTRSYKRLPSFSFWKCGVFRFRFKLVKRLRIMIRGKKL